MTNLEKAREILRVLEAKHKNLYHSVTKEEVKEFFESVDWNKLSEMEFDFNMLRLFAMFKDAHTVYFAGGESLPNRFVYVQGKAYLRKNGVFREIVSINGVSIEEVVKKFEPLIPYEVDDWKNHTLSNKLRNVNYYKMIGLYGENGLDIECKTEEGNVVYNTHAYSEEELQQIRKSENYTMMANSSDDPSYSYSVENDILYLKYKRCRNDENKPFKEVVKEIEKLYNEGRFKGYIVDLRNNGGGSDAVFYPFYKFADRYQLPGVGLINNGTFSSGFLNALDLKFKVGAVLIGENCGMGNEHYGECVNETVDGKRFMYCTKKFEYKKLFDYEGGFRPDIYLPKTIEDYNQEKDRQKERAYEEVKKLIAQQEREKQ